MYRYVIIWRRNGFNSMLIWRWAKDEFVGLKIDFVFCWLVLDFFLLFQNLNKIQEGKVVICKSNIKIC